MKKQKINGMEKKKKNEKKKKLNSYDNFLSLFYMFSKHNYNKENEKEICELLIDYLIDKNVKIEDLYLKLYKDIQILDLMELGFPEPPQR